MTNKELFKIIKALKSNEMEGFDQLYYATKDIVYYTILAIIKDPSLSEDIMQDTYLTMLEKIHSFKQNTSVKSWLTTIARNKALNEYKRRKRELKLDITEDEDIFGHTESSSEKELIVREILKELNEIERDIVIYKILGDLTFKEIAKILEMPQGTVSWKYQEAIKRLRNTNESR